jgi:hypothetical protein
VVTTMADGVVQIDLVWYAPNSCWEGGACAVLLQTPGGRGRRQAVTTSADGCHGADRFGVVRARHTGEASDAFDHAMVGGYRVSCARDARRRVFAIIDGLNLNEI